MATLDNMIEKSVSSDLNSYHAATQNRVIPVGVNLAKNTVAIHDFPANSVVEPFWHPVAMLDNIITRSVSSIIIAKNTVVICDFPANSVVEPLWCPF